MSVKVFVYDCALCGAWAAFVVWLVASTRALRRSSPIGPASRGLAGAGRLRPP